MKYMKNLILGLINGSNKHAGSSAEASFKTGDYRSDDHSNDKMSVDIGVGDWVMFAAIICMAVVAIVSILS